MEQTKESNVIKQLITAKLEFINNCFILAATTYRLH